MSPALRSGPRFFLTALLSAVTALSLGACGDDTGGGTGGSGGSSGTGPESICGDNLHDEDLGEECDDGDLDDTDDCKSDCTEAFCGDGVVHLGFEDCDDGNDEDADKCTNGCTPGAPGCGNGVVDEGEECDDGNTADDDACTRNCTNARCGDGIVQNGEACDDANPNDGDACSNSCQSNGVGCGNGTVDAGEACDDGNASNADECLNDCVEATCGDGFARVGAEDCDDGNDNDADFCTNACTLNEGTTTACPGIAIPLGVGQVSLQANTSNGEANEQGTCGGGQASEVVFEVQPDASGVLVVQLEGDGSYDPILYARAGSCESGAELGCADQSFQGGVETLTLEAFAGESLWVVADGYGQSSGPFFIDFALLAGAPGDDCPGLPVSIAAFDQLDISGNTNAAEDDLAGQSACAAGNGAKDIVYAVTPEDDGIITVALQADFDAMLYSQITCGVASSQFDCADNQFAGGIETTQLPAYAGETIWLVVDGYDGEAGPYSLTMSLAP